MIQEDIKLLNNQVKEFKSFIDGLSKQQLFFPLDEKSKELIRKDLVYPNGDSLIPANLGTYDNPVEVMVNSVKYLLETTSAY